LSDVQGVDGARGGTDGGRASRLARGRERENGMTARTVTTRMLVARAREHGRALRTLGDAVEWSGMAWSAVVSDPEWMYNATARDACTAAARLLAGTQGIRHRGVDDLRPDDAVPRVVELRGEPVLRRGSAGRMGLGWLGGGRRSHGSGANR
jgi:hypothetical protein